MCLVYIQTRDNTTSVVWGKEVVKMVLNITIWFCDSFAGRMLISISLNKLSMVTNFS